MKNLILVAVALVLGVSTLSAKTNSDVLVEDFKSEVSKHIAYPEFAIETMTEGEVWMKITLDEKSEIKIVEISSTNADLKAHVESQLEDITLENTNFEIGKEYMMKVTFDLLN
jgi:hypothetical protein